MKSTKEPKERKKSSAKPRKGSDKSKQVVAEPAPQMAQARVAEPPAAAPAYSVNESGNGNGAAAASPAAPKAVNGTGETSSAAQPAVAIDPPRELIEVRAYELFVQRGYVHGHQEEDWLAAERELKSRHRNV
ncbi:MAG TPA: DUF2934 domain-containing protein [Candidatus Binataceae bacterium]|nr:DUF2934 domain-containing protein [Candidatus Binataceae bacterium]